MKLYRLLLTLTLLLSTTSWGITDKPDPQLAAATGISVELTGFNSISIVGPIGASTASDFVSDLLRIDDKEVLIFLDSPGGSIIAGNSIITAMKDSGKKTICIAKFAASMAFIILQACDERFVTRDGVIMQHVASYGVQGQAPNNVSMVNFLERLVKALDMDQAARIGLEYEVFKTKTRDDWWLYSVDAVTANTADGIAVVTCSDRLIKQIVTKDIPIMFFTVKVQMSACPLITKMTPVNKRNNRQQEEYLGDVFTRDAFKIKALNQITTLEGGN